MEIVTAKKSYPFLQDGGEMGELTRQLDWSQTALGSPDTWPFSLRVTVSNLLRSKFPMFLWWGKDMIQFYNDAYRPSLGNNGKHPYALGQGGKECWPEIWEMISPLIKEVETTGESTWREDQLLPIYRNGKMEDVYWTYSYSSVLDDEGNHAGILVTCVETTEKVKTQTRVGKSERNLRNIILQAPVAMCILSGPDQIVEIANERMFELWGRKKEELLNKSIFLGLPEARGQGYEALLDQVFTTGKTFSANGVPINLPRNGGIETIYINLVYEAYRESNGIISGVMAVASDVTEQVLANQKIAASEQQVRSLVESAPFPIGVYIGKEMRITLANQSIIDVWGKGPDVIGKLYAAILPELDNQEIFGQLDAVYTTGVPFHIRNQRVDLMVSGKLQSYYFNYSFTPLFDEAGKVYGTMNTAADVTDLNVAKQKIEQSEQNFRNLVMQAPVAMCILMGPDHTVSIANDFMIDLWGKPAAAVMNKPLFEGLPDAGAQGFETLLSDVYTTGKTFKADERPVQLFRNGKLETVYQNFVYEPYKDTDGKILGVLAITIDVSSQVLARLKIEEVVAERTKALGEANAALVHTNEELARSNANLGEFAYAASHDLKEPIRKIHFFADRIKVSISDKFSPNEIKYFSRMEEAAKRMAMLVDDLLAYSQVSLMPKTAEAININRLIDTVLIDLDLEIEQKNAMIKVDNLFTIEGHHRQLQQAFQNLISNALKYNKQGIAPEVLIKSKIVSGKDAGFMMAPEEMQKDFHVISIQDNGIGFAQEDAERIFNVFTRLHSHASIRGTGVGLSIVKRVIENHRGYITARSAVGEGSTFYIYFPVNN